MPTSSAQPNEGKDLAKPHPEPKTNAHNSIEKSPSRSQQRRTRASDTDRDTVVSALSDALSRGQLTAVEFDERHSQALEAMYIDQLPELIDDIPEAEELEQELRSRDTARRGTTDVATKPGSHLGPYNNQRPGPIQPAKPGSGKSDTAICILSGSNQVVEPNTPKVNALALLGGNDYDLCDVMGPGVEFTIESVNFLGGHDIYVPPGVRIIDKSISILGGVDIAQNARGDGSNGTLIISGFNLLGGDDVLLARGYRQSQQ
ncbi:DUF1707 domain-containing protein [Brevibacterium sp. UMB10442]|nr:DUF1707 domain-containing protein [Brevibacterium sp. UMB10442]